MLRKVLSLCQAWLSAAVDVGDDIRVFQSVKQTVGSNRLGVRYQEFAAKRQQAASKIMSLNMTRGLVPLHPHPPVGAVGPPLMKTQHVSRTFHAAKVNRVGE